MPTFNFTGAEQTYTVPTGVTTVGVELYGGEGEDGTGSRGAFGVGDPGGKVVGQLSVTPSETLYVYVGGGNGNQFNGGGAGGDPSGDEKGGDGGGASDIRQGGNALADRVAVAAGGGGGGDCDPEAAGSSVAGDGGQGGANTGQSGQDAEISAAGSSTGGGGGTQSAGGAAGSFGGSAGSLGQGGAGSTNGGAASGGGGGGGGGYYGGGGGGTDDDNEDTVASGGGGGSNYTGGLAVVTTNQRGGGGTGHGQVIIVEPPADPSGLTATTFDDDRIDLSWTDNASDEDGYRVYRAQVTGGPYTQTGSDLAANTTSFSDTGLEAGEEYFYIVRAFNNAGESGNSNEDSAITDLPATTPSLDASVEDEITLTWTKQDDSTDGNWEIYRSEDGTLGSLIETTVDETTTSYTDTGREDGEEYHYTLRRVTDHASSDGTQQSAIALLPAPDPVTVTATADDELTVNWTRQDDQPDGEFELYRSTDGTLGSLIQDAISVGTSQHVDSGLALETTYYYTVRRVGPHSTSDATQQAATTLTTDEGSVQTGAGSTLLVADSTNVQETPPGQAAAGTVVALTEATETVSLKNYWIRFEDSAGAELETAQVLDVNFTKEHTALSGWSMTLPYNLSLEDWLFSDVRIYFNDEFLFRGFFQTIDTDEQRGTTTVGGYGIEHKLERDEASVSYTDQFADVALQDYFDNHSNISGTVTTPSTQTVTDEELASLSTTADFNAEFTPAATDPVVIETNELRAAKVSYLREAEAFDSISTAGTVNSSTYSGGSAEEINDITHQLSYDFTPEYDIPSGNVRVSIRGELLSGSNPSNLDITIGGTAVDSGVNITSSLGWDQYTGWSGGDLQAGTTYTLELDCSLTDDPIAIDLVSVNDDRFTFNFDNSTDVNDALSGPEDFPPNGIAACEQQMAEQTTPYNITAVTIDTTWNDTTGDQRVGYSVDGGSSFSYFANTADVTDDPVSVPSTAVIVAVRPVGYTSGSPTTTPTTGNAGQAVSTLTLTIDGNTRGVIVDEEFSGDHLSNIQLLCKRAGMRAVLPHVSDDVNLDFEAFLEGDVTGQATWEERNRTRSVDVKDYANTVMMYGAKDGTGNRVALPSPVVNDAEVTRVGEVKRTFVAPDISDVDQLQSEARKRLGRRIAQDKVRGSIDIFPTNVTPGKSYPVPEWDADVAEGFYALEFSGNPDVVDSGATATDLGIGGSNAKSILAWVKPAEGLWTGGSDQGMWEIGSQSNDEEFSLRAEGSTEGRFRIQIWGPNDFEVTTTMREGSYSPVALVYEGSGGDVVLYVDGAEAARFTPSTDLNTQNAKPFRVGEWDNKHWEGQIDAPQVYARAISPWEASEHAAGRAIDSTGLALSYAFDEGSGSTATDDAGTNDGTITGATYVGGGGFALETVEYGFSARGQPRGRLKFVKPSGLAGRLTDARQSLNETRDAL